MSRCNEQHERTKAGVMMMIGDDAMINVNVARARVSA
jgi:hypothetical protein